MKYIIDDTIVFIPGHGLYHVTSESVEFKLSLISDRVLFLLVTLNTEAVSKQEIHDYLWKECSVDASIASINNNLSYLRKFFKEMGMSDLIVTTPRVGVSFRQGTSIAFFSEEIVPDKTEGYACTEVANKSMSNTVKWGGAILFGTVLSFSLSFLLLHSGESDPLIHIGDVGKCKVFSLEKLSSIESTRLIAHANTFVKNEKIDCNDGKVVIANSQEKGKKYIRANRDFFSICDINKNHLYMCDNYYYLEGVE